MNALRPKPVRRAFTLLELMISIAMVLVLLIGVNQVFTYTTQAVGAGQALSSNTRDSRAVQTAFTSDLSGAATTDGPFFIIHSANVYAFRDRADFAGSKTQDASKIDLNGNGVEGETTAPGEVVAPTTLNSRNHRLDVLTFFARGRFPAQTGATQLIYPNVASQEARIWYGFCKLPDNSYLNPGDTGYSGTTHYFFPGLQWQKTVVTAGYTPDKNSNNFFATDWILGRTATLLFPAAPPTVTNSFVQPPVTPPVALSPLTAESQLIDTTVTPNVTYKGNESRYDVATNTSIAGYYSHLTGWINNPVNAAQNWWSFMSGGGDFMLGYWGNAVADTTYECNPFITAASSANFSTMSAQLTPAKAARASPYFIKGCTQFCVEFAGDFFTQQNDPTIPATYGNVTGIVNSNTGNGDGIDYSISTDAPGNKTRHVRWYGFPRNSNNGLTVPTSGTDPNAMINVVPFRDVFLAGNSEVVANGGAAMAYYATSFERSFPTVGVPADYSATLPSAMNDYLCAWGPDTDAAGVPRPKMIRITFTIDSGNKQLPDGQTYQYVYTLP